MNILQAQKEVVQAKNNRRARLISAIKGLNQINLFPHYNKDISGNGAEMVCVRYDDDCGILLFDSDETGYPLEMWEDDDNLCDYIISEISKVVLTRMRLAEKALKNFKDNEFEMLRQTAIALDDITLGDTITDVELGVNRAICDIQCAIDALA